MERSDLNTAEERIAYDNGFATASRMYRAEAKARYDRFVCAVVASDPDRDMATDEIAEWAIQIMLAADKRWEEYVKQQTEEVK